MKVYIYADILFIKNFAMNMLLLFVLLKLLKIKISHIRCKLAAASATGALCQLISLKLFIDMPAAFYCISAGVSGIFMLLIIGVWKGYKELIKSYCILLFISLMLNGAYEFINSVSDVMSFAVLIPAAIAVTVLAQSSTVKKNTYEVCLYYKDKKYSCTAFYDTGNSLVNPFNLKPAAVMDKDAFYEFTGIAEFKTFGTNEFKDNKICILPYKSAGCKNGIIYGIIADKLEINSNGKKLDIDNVPIGCVEGLISKDKEYVMLLPANVGL